MEKWRAMFAALYGLAGLFCFGMVFHIFIESMSYWNGPFGFWNNAPFMGIFTLIGAHSFMCVVSVLKGNR